VIKSKKEAIKIIRSKVHGDYMVNVLECQDRFSGKSAKLLKCLATFAENGVSIDFQPYSFEPKVDYVQVSWTFVEVFGEAMRRDEINSTDVRVAANKNQVKL